MTSLLTLNGIPPQPISSIADEDRHRLAVAVKGYYETDSYSTTSSFQVPVQPFVSVFQNAVDRFSDWGATIHQDEMRINLIASDLNIGQTSFVNDGPTLKTY